jgi:hypothetical protein
MEHDPIRSSSQTIPSCYAIQARPAQRLAGRPKDRISSPSKVKDFRFSTSSRPDVGPLQPPFQWVSGALSPGVKRSGCEVDHSPPASAEIKKTLISTSLSHASSWRSA